MIKKFKTQNSKFKTVAVKYFLLFTFYFFIIHASAQTVSASLDRDKILLGEQVTLQFTLANINENTTFVSGWPQLSDTINHTEILKRNPIDTIKVNDANTYQQNFTITSFDSGKWQIGPFIFSIQDKITGKKIQVTSAPLFITVLAVDVSSLKDYHPIKDVIDVPTSFNWMPVIIAIGVLILAIIIFLIIKKRKKKIASEPKVVLKGTPLERAIEKLHLLEKESLSSIESVRKYHSDIDIIVRQYFEEMTQVKALQLTTKELFNRLHVYMQDANLRSKFLQVFETNGSVKFAKYTPEPDESKKTLKEIISSIQQIDDTVNAARNNANRLVQKY